MTAMNVVHMRVKPGKEEEFLRIHREEFNLGTVPGGRNLWLVRTGERDFTVVGEWDGMAELASARPQMIGTLDRLRPILEDLGGGRGVTEPWSGEVTTHLTA